MVKCRRKHFLFLYDKQGILTLWIPVLAAVASSVCWNPPWSVERIGVCAAEHHGKDPQLKLMVRGLQIEDLGNLGFFVNVPEGGWPST